MIDHVCHDYYNVALIENVQFERIYVDRELHISGIGDDNLRNIKN